MTTSPQSYLAPQSQPWGRFVDKSLADLTETTRLNDLNTSNNLKQLNSSVNLLSNQQVALAAQQTQLTNQQNYLATFQTYITSQPSTVSGYTYYSILPLTSASLTFTLSRTSTLLIGSQFYYQGTSRENNGYSASFQVIQNLTVNGSTDTSHWADYEYGVVGSITMHQSTGSAVTQYLKTLPAGTHTVNLGLNYYLGGTQTNLYGVVVRNLLLTATVVG